MSMPWQLTLKQGNWWTAYSQMSCAAIASHCTLTASFLTLWKGHALVPLFYKTAKCYARRMEAWMGLTLDADSVCLSLASSGLTLWYWDTKRNLSPSLWQHHGPAGSSCTHT